MDRQIKVSYVKNIIGPLEKMIQQVQVCNDVSLDELMILDVLLLEKYLMIERILKDLR